LQENFSITDKISIQIKLFPNFHNKIFHYFSCGCYNVPLVPNVLAVAGLRAIASVPGDGGIPAHAFVPAFASVPVVAGALAFSSVPGVPSLASAFRCISD
jgi:hypothetical protein